MEITNKTIEEELTIEVNRHQQKFRLKPNKYKNINLCIHLQISLYLFIYSALCFKF